LHRYTRTSIQAAKRNAQKHREADGGEISWRNESLRRHGKLDPPEEQEPLKQLAGMAKDNLDALRSGAAGKVEPTTVEEKKVRERAGKGRGSS